MQEAREVETKRQNNQFIFYIYYTSDHGDLRSQHVEQPGG